MDGSSSKPQKTKGQAIAEALRRKIMAGDIARGEHLRQDRLACEFETSSTPVREALRRLEAEGLVVFQAHRGVRVAGVDFERIKAVYVQRMLLEPYAMARAVLRISRHQLKGAYTLLEELEAARQKGDGELRNELTRRFHFFFYDRCGLPGIVGQIGSLWDAFPWDLTLDDSARAAQSHAQHAEQLQAAYDIDVELSEELSRAHIRDGFLTLAATVQGCSVSDVADPFSIDVD